MPIEKVVIKNFKQFKDSFTVHFKEGMNNVLVGENHAVPPEILIEVYLKSGTVPEYEGNGNMEKRNAWIHAERSDK